MVCWQGRQSFSFYGFCSGPIVSVFGFRSSLAVFRDDFRFLCSLFFLSEMRIVVYYGMSSHGGRESSLQVHAQQSVHLTCGSLRVLQAFFWLRAFSTSQALSTPAHKQVMQTVRYYVLKKRSFLVSSLEKGKRERSLP